MGRVKGLGPVKRKKTDSSDTAENKKPAKENDTPSEADEDHRHLHRELEVLKAERTRHSNRLKGLLFGVGFQVESVNCLNEAIPELDGNGQPIMPHLQARIKRPPSHWASGRLISPINSCPSRWPGQL